MANPNNLPASRDLRKLLERAQKDYQDNLTNLTDAAADDIETALHRGDLDIKELVNSYARDASQLANDYYDQLRGLWAEQSDEPMPDFVHGKLVDPSRVLWQVEHGFSNTDFNGLTYKQVMEGRSRAGMTIDDLWPPLDNVDDAQQFIADMIQSAGRLTMQRNIKLDPTKPKWARVCGGAKPCAFCVMLASRGFAYNSQETADFGPGFHDGHCHCTVVPSWGKDDILLKKQAQWKGMYKDSIKAAGGTKVKGKSNAYYSDVLAAMRRLYANELKDGVIPVPDIRWSHKPLAPTKDELERLSDMTIVKPGDRYSPERKKAALVDWSGDDYTQINGYLFGLTGETPAIRSWVSRIDEAMNDHETRRAFTVDRLMRLDFFKVNSVDDVVDIKRGTKFPHAGYAAGTTNIGGVAAGDGDRVAARILVPPGSHGVYLEPFTQHPGEHEILLPRNQMFMIDGFGTLPDGSPLVYLRMV
ncbi:hypothetical protein KIH79_09255 [Bifidobacterium sp. 82T10]|uniref:ADP ribosyltransferase domain-containing protein n=1 Tax=Bifidobacterium miconis TaxID=2834435 RepID=A0ABS6WGC4_9BIFI|nr:ADP-ribosyltransferase [Bifidobacterium miconis]MBW3093103.1 hypothetical protein [Bifidobacterium miconis]